MKIHLPLSLRQALLFAVLSVPSQGAEVGSTWDPAWGSSGLAGAPDAAEQKYAAEITSDGVTALVPPPGGSSPYDFGTYSAITLLGSGNAGAIIVGGASATQSNTTGAVTRNSWIAAEQGNYSMLVGGSYADNWSAGAAFNFTGDSHIMLTGGNVGCIVGGNLKDGQSASFTGDSYISIAGGNVSGTIVGAGVVAHDRNCEFNGDTHIFVYVPLSDNSGPAFNQLPANMIMGGFGWATNTRKTQTINGSTYVTVDLSNYAGSDVDFAKHVVGGGFGGNSVNKQVITGNTDVRLNLGNLAISARVIGGMWVNSGTGEINGTANLTITGGTFNNLVVGGAWTDVGGTTTRLGGVSMALSGATFNAEVMGGTYITTGNCTMSCGDVTVDVGSSATLNSSLTGGYCIFSTGSGTVDASLGDVNISLNGGTVTAVTGGSYTVRNNAAAAITQGNINLELNSGSVTGSVYAAGYQGGTTTMLTESTTVSITPTVELSPGITISGGYGGTSITSTVSGTRALSFSAGEYNVSPDITFADFDTVTVPLGTSVELGTFSSSTNSFTKLGGGNLNIASHPQFDSLNVEGELVLLSGVSGASLQSLSMSAGALLSGVSGSIAAGESGGTVLNLVLNSSNVGAGTAATPLITGGVGSPVDMDLAGGENVTIDLSSEGLMELLLEHRDALPPVTSYLSLVDGKLSVRNPSQLSINTLLNTYGLRVSGAEDGSLLVNGAVDGIYFVTADAATTDPHEVTTYPSLGLYAGVLIDENQQLTINLPGDTDSRTRVTINNLMGGADSLLSVQNNSGSGMVTVLLSNQAIAETGDSSYPSLPARSVMQGGVTAGDGTELLKVGPGELVVNGNVSADAVSVLSGTLSLCGTNNVVNSLQLSDGVLQGGNSGLSELTVQQSLSVGDSAEMAGLHLVLPPAATADFGTATGVELLSLSGSGTLQGNGAQLSVNSGAESYFAGALSGSATLSISNGSLYMDNVKTESGSAWNLINYSTLSADISSTQQLSLGTLTMGAGSVNELLLDTDLSIADSLLLQGLTVEPGVSTVRLSSVGARLLGSGDYVLGRVNTPSDISVQGTVSTELVGLPFAQLLADSSYIYTDSSGNIVLHAVRSSENLLLPYADSPNSAAGAHLLWDAEPPGHGDLSQAYAELLQLVENRQQREAAALLAAVAGSSTATIGAALSGDVERQLRSIRNRVATMGVNPCVVNDDMPYYNFWVQAEGDYRHLSSAHQSIGYKMERWGGTVGINADINPALTAGLAISGLYGELSTSGAERLDCDVSTWYLSAFGRYLSRPWIHSFVATFGWAHAEPNRRVDIGALHYRTQGDSDGFALGVMYELAYHWQPDAYNPDFSVQPLFNISYRHSALSSYTESGSDAALRVSSHSMDTVRLSLGVRLQAEFGENIFNRSSFFECRAMAGFDMGDRHGLADVALVNGDSHARVRSAAPGAFGAELGMGLAVPIGEENGALFLDTSVLLRSHQSEFNATVGYKNRF